MKQKCQRSENCQSSEKKVMAYDIRVRGLSSQGLHPGHFLATPPQIKRHIFHWTPS